jgi:ribonuclease P protein subunit RPR2
MHKPISHERIAKERIAELFRQADEQFKDYPELSRRYVKLARKIAMKYRVRFTKEQKRMFCKACDAYLKQGKNSTIRLQHGKLVLRCSECGFVRRFVYKK